MLASMTAHHPQDRFEDQPSFDKAGRALGDAFDRLPQWEQRLQTLRVLPGSSLAADDLATAYDPISTQLEGALAHALDHLMTIEALVRKAEVLPAMAGFTLLRSAVESVGVGLWMLGPRRRDERVLRALKMDYEALLDVYGIGDELAGKEQFARRLPDGHQTGLRLEQLRDARPGLKGRAIHDMPSITRRLREADKYVMSPGNIPLVALWRVLSGVAHGRRHLLANLLNREVVGVDAKTYSMRLTSSLSTLTGSYYVAEYYMSQLVKLYLVRSDRDSSIDLTKQLVISSFHRPIAAG